MIETLNGIHETVNFKENSGFRLYDNNEYENYPSHWHTPLEIVMPIQNQYEVICNGKNYTLRETDILIINSGVIHSLNAPPTGERLFFQPDFILLHNIKELESTLSIISPVFLITAENSPIIHAEVARLMLKIRDEYYSTDILSNASIYAMLIQIFVLIGRNCANNNEKFDVNSNKQKEYTEKFLAVCSYINEHCTEDLTLDEVANLIGFSKYHFTRLFKQFTGVSFYKYLNQKRIACAEKLLVNPDISITVVSLQSGFSSLSAFIRMFKIIKNCTPTEFRNMYSS